MPAGAGEPMGPIEESFGHLASYRKFVERIRAAWPGFAARRGQRLQQRLSDAAVEKSAENILEDLFTTVLDWPLADVLLQEDGADVVLSRSGFKRLVLEVKRPGSLTRHRVAINKALEQARRYAADQRVRAVAVSDATMLYAQPTLPRGAARSCSGDARHRTGSRSPLVVVSSRYLPGVAGGGGSRRRAESRQHRNRECH
jgi:hypothetical protein